MKTRFIIFLLIIAGTQVNAQQGGKKSGPIREKIRAQRVAFITERLNLSTEEAEKFWPVYNKFTDELEEIKKTQNQARRNANDKLAVLSDKEVEKLLEDDLAAQQKVVDLQRKYQVELRKVISVKKILMLYKAERDFKLELLKKVKNATGGGGTPVLDEEN